MEDASVINHIACGRKGSSAIRQSRARAFRHEFGEANATTLERLSEDGLKQIFIQDLAVHDPPA